MTCTATKANGDICTNKAINGGFCGVHKSKMIKFKHFDICVSSRLNGVKTLRVLDLFSGMGGTALGLQNAGLKVICGIDYWNVCLETYVKNLRHTGLCRDLTKYSVEEFMEEQGIQPKHIDVIVSTSPCISFTMCGKRDVNDPRSDLYKEFLKYLNFIMPKVFIIENVVGLLSAKDPNGNLYIDKIMKKLEKNYNCIVMVLNASDFKVPQNRKRVIIYGIRKDLDIIPTEIEKKSKRIYPCGDCLISQEEFEQEGGKYLEPHVLKTINNRRRVKRETGKGFCEAILDSSKPAKTIIASYLNSGQSELICYDGVDENEAKEIAATFPLFEYFEIEYISVDKFY